MHRILIADDSIYMRETLREILHEAGYEIVGEAVNGLNAVEIYRALVPDIVILDITTPQGDGIDALKNIIEINPDAIVIMMTVAGKPDKVLEALDNGAKSYLTKPFDKVSVINSIRQATARV